MIAEELKQKRLLRKQLLDQAKQDGSDIRELEKQFKSKKSSKYSSIENQQTKSSSIDSTLYNFQNRVQTQQQKQRINKIPNLIKKISKNPQCSQQYQTQQNPLKLTQQMSSQNKQNLHKNFVDLNPIYHQQKHQRAVKFANYIVSNIKKDLKQKVEVKAREIFNYKIQNGLKLSYLELQKLKSDWKNDYIRQQLKEDEEIKEYAAKVQRKADCVYDDDAEAIMKIEDLEQQWEDHQVAFSDLVEKKAKECGIINRRDLKHYFQEFDILDMYLNQEDKCTKCNKIQCWACNKGYKCQKHDLQKMDVAYSKDEQFKGRHDHHNQTKLKPIQK